jgi:endonuclease/exonuclease/phosphatase family metal-dependent hydrolase
VRWFPRGTASGRDPTLRTDIEWLACAVATLEVDALALQEILDDADGRAAAVELTTQLDALTQGDWKLELDDCSGRGRQHVGLLWNQKRVVLADVGPIEALNPTGSACGSGLRPGLSAHARFATGIDAFLVVLHLDSGQAERDWKHRAQSVEAFTQALAPLRSRDDDLIVLGDYNTMGCDRCTPVVSAEQELAKLDELLARAKLSRVQLEPHACSHYYRNRVGLLDHIAVSEGLRGRTRATTRGVCDELACKAPPRGEHILAWDTLSDHCPQVVELQTTTRGQASGR